MHGWNRLNAVPHPVGTMTVVSTNQPHTPNVNINDHRQLGVPAPNIDPTGTAESTAESNAGTPRQLTLEGFADPRDSIDPRFLLSEETCRIGRKYLAEMRRILATGHATAA